MAATKSRNETPNTPDVSESKIARMKVDELRRELKNRGVKGTADLRKPELVKKLVKAELKAGGGKKPVKAGGGKKPVKAGGGEKPVKAELKAGGKKKKPAGRNETPDTPEVSESKIARMKASELRSRLSRRGVKGTAEMKKPELVERFVKSELKAAKKSTRTTAGAKAGGATTGSGKRVGKKTSKSVEYSQEITSTSDRPERAGRSLVTTDHEVIRQWAKARRAIPSSVAGTQHDGHLGVLRFDFPGYSGDRLVEVSWAEWFEAFDKRRLNFIYQERRSGGERSNFFQLENPDS